MFKSLNARINVFVVKKMFVCEFVCEMKSRVTQINIPYQWSINTNEIRRTKTTRLAEKIRNI